MFFPPSRQWKSLPACPFPLPLPRSNCLLTLPKPSIFISGVNFPGCPLSAYVFAAIARIHPSQSFSNQIFIQNSPAFPDDRNCSSIRILIQPLYLHRLTTGPLFHEFSGIVGKRLIKLGGINPVQPHFHIAFPVRHNQGIPVDNLFYRGGKCLGEATAWTGQC